MTQNWSENAEPSGKVGSGQGEDCLNVYFFFKFTI